MMFYRFSPIKSREKLNEAIEYIHFSCHVLCKSSLGEYLTVVGNIAIFCHYDDEYEYLSKLRNELTDSSVSFANKYFKLYKPITFFAKNDVPQAVYTHLYIRKPDPYRSQVGDADFSVSEEAYQKLKADAKNKKIVGARIFDQHEPQMIELYNPDIDVLSYVWHGVMPK